LLLFPEQLESDSELLLPMTLCSIIFPMFSYGIYKVLVVTLRYLIPFKLVFVQDEIQGSSFANYSSKDW
jgi:hypothetical protein